MPIRRRVWANSVRVPPYRSAEATRLSPASTRVSTDSATAAIPEATATADDPPSSAATARSSPAHVGLPYRLYVKVSPSPSRPYARSASARLGSLNDAVW